MKLTPWMLTLAAFAIVCTLTTMFLFKKLMATEVAAAPRNEMRNLPMAITEIEPGTVITMKHIGNGPVDRAVKLPTDTILALESVVGRIARDRIPAAAPLQGSMFYAVGDYPDLQVEPGKRAVTVHVSDAAAILSGLIKTGQYVDVHMTMDTGDRLQSAGRSPASGRGGMTATLFKGVKVVAMNRGNANAALQGGESRNVTLELDENQTLVMLLAQQKGQIALTYNPGGPGVGGISVRPENDRVTMEQLLGMTEPHEELKPFRTENYRGGGHSTSYWQDGERVENQSSRDTASGTQLQSTGDSVGNWSTHNTLPDRNSNLTQQPVTTGKL